MPSLDDQRLHLTVNHVQSHLLFGNGWCRFDGSTDNDRHAAGDATENTAIVVGFRPDGVAIQIHAVIGFRAAHGSDGEAGTKFHALDSRNREQHGRNASFRGTQHGRAQTCRYTGNSTFNDAAHGITGHSRLFDLCQHSFLCPGIDNRIGLGTQLCQLFIGNGHIIKRCIHNLSDRSDMRAYLNALGTEEQLTHGTCKYHRCGQTTGKMSAAPVIVAAMIPDTTGIIRMTRTGMFN